MFYRRKIILSLLQLFDGKLEKIRLQKLLFLFTRKQEKRVYDFIPYRYGCYSYSANADMTAMVKRKFLQEDEKHFKKNNNIDYLSQIIPTDIQNLHSIVEMYGTMDVKELIRLTYREYPFYAIKSEIAHQIMSNNEMETLRLSRPVSHETVLFTIGYEGISLEEYLVRLLLHDIKVLVDVRNNPQSMKYGFSKSHLQKYCESLGIVYVHVPEVGIQSEKRKSLFTQNDYDELFQNYKKDNLTKTTDAQLRIFALLKQYERIALTCFEANVCQCHRKHLAESIEQYPDFVYQVKHI